MVNIPRILILDSSVAMRSGLKTLLRPLNAQIVEASDGLTGLKLLSENRFDIIITSIDMPQMNGVELCRRVKNTLETQDVSVIILSSFDSDADIEKALEAGASAYIKKREAQDRLYDTVQNFLSQTSPESQRTIMVVDDSRPIRTLMQKGLLEVGFQVITAENGKEALNLLNDHCPDLILSDINMPEMDGFALCEALHSDPAFATIPFVVMSTIAERKEMRRIIKYGATDYMVKPFNVDELVIHIERFLEDRFLLLLKDKERLDTERDMMLGSIASLTMILEARDSRLKEHADAVADIASGVAALTGASKKEIELVALGAKLHDIGKLGLKDAILFKAKTLNDQEQICMRQHPRIGHNILKAIPHLPSDILTIVLSHHERPDGKGYPRGLRVDQIPRWAGITAVANAYHKLLDEGIPHEKALQIIEDISGTELCTDYVYLFLDWVAKKKR